MSVLIDFRRAIAISLFVKREHVSGRVHACAIGKSVSLCGVVNQGKAGPWRPTSKQLSCKRCVAVVNAGAPRG